MENQYVILTGSKNNAGDYLIKYRAKKLFAWLRPDRNIIDMDGWKPLSDKDLITVNRSRALILMGGPALQEKMMPRVYRLREDLNEIKVPIISMGIGWHSSEGKWHNTHDYPLNTATLQLISRIDSSGYQSSVRDYHTHNVLRHLGYKNFSMTGCPALFSQQHLGTTLIKNNNPSKIGFSLGVSLKSSKAMEDQMKEAIIATRDNFKNAKVEVVFHHAITKKESKGKLFESHQSFIKWLNTNKISYIDISGAAENLIGYYQDCDLHIGYRVHAHIFMNSISKPSVLLNEDGRGIALRDVIAGITFDAYEQVKNDHLFKLLKKIRVHQDQHVAASNLPTDLIHAINDEYNGGVRFEQPRQNIDSHFGKMKSFIEQLP